MNLIIKKFKFVLIIIFFTLTGCAEYSQYTSNMKYLLSEFKQQDISIAYSVLGKPTHIQKVNDEILAYSWDYYENSQLACRFLFGVHIPTNLIVEYDFHDGTFIGCNSYDSNLRTYSQVKRQTAQKFSTPIPTDKDMLNFLNSSAFGTHLGMTEAELTQKGVNLKPVENHKNSFTSTQAPVVTNYINQYIYQFNNKGKLCSVTGITPLKINIVDITMTFLTMNQLLIKKYGEPYIQDKVTDNFPTNEWSKMVSALNGEYPPVGIVYTWNKNLISTFKDPDNNNIELIRLYPMADPHIPTLKNGYIKDTGLTLLEFYYGSCK